MTSHDVVAVAPPLSIDPARISQALRDLWKDAERQDDESKTALVRSCGLTLIAIAPTGSEFDRLRTLVAQATEAVPARTILVEIGADVAEMIHAEVTAYCAITPGSTKQMCQELVILRIHAEAAADLAGVMTPLVVTDLPVVMLIPSVDLLAAAWLDRLLPLADVLITDSARGASLSRALERVLRRNADPRLAIRDFAYERLACWREVLAQAWDETVGRGAHLDAIEIESDPVDPPGVFLLAYTSVALGRDAAQRVRRTPLPSDARQAGAATGLVFATSVNGVPSRIVFRQCGSRVTRLDEGAKACELPRSISGDCEILHGILLGTDCDALFDRVLVKAFDLLEPAS